MGQPSDPRPTLDRSLPVLIAGARTETCGAARRSGLAGAFDAHLLGQHGRKRGLKAGPVAIEAARCAYLSAEWSGEADRRLPAGLITRGVV